MLLALLRSQECIAVSRDDDVAVSRDRYVIILRDRNAWPGASQRVGKAPEGFITVMKMHIGCMRPPFWKMVAPMEKTDGPREARYYMPAQGNNFNPILQPADPPQVGPILTVTGVVPGGSADLQFRRIPPQACDTAC
ncbi:unnamed protein product [Ranitomeya imitator]|uniref:Uncharacterized protein n=1 Tax=Ranitomeya imitator TaxID=111125 RepID=A0ABN9M2Q1_9NEOB|nr:unnamed protein product [Ranitomeya imitator]